MTKSMPTLQVSRTKSSRRLMPRLASIGRPSGSRSSLIGSHGASSSVISSTTSAPRSTTSSGQLVLLSGNEPGRNNQFPISPSERRYRRAKRDGRPSTRDRCLKGVAEELRALIDEVQPYRGGYPVAWHAYAVLAWLSN